MEELLQSCYEEMRQRLFWRPCSKVGVETAFVFFHNYTVKTLVDKILVIYEFFPSLIVNDFLPMMVL